MVSKFKFYPFWCFISLFIYFCLWFIIPYSLFVNTSRNPSKENLQLSHDFLHIPWASTCPGQVFARYKPNLFMNYCSKNMPSICLKPKAPSIISPSAAYFVQFSVFIFNLNRVFECTESQLKLKQFWIVNKQKYYLSYCGFIDVRSGCKSREFTQDTAQYLWRNSFIFFLFSIQVFCGYLFHT